VAAGIFGPDPNPAVLIILGPNPARGGGILLRGSAGLLRDVCTGDPPESSKGPPDSMLLLLLCLIGGAHVSSPLPGVSGIRLDPSATHK
jgi:hypothetical protein